MYHCGNVSREIPVSFNGRIVNCAEARRKQLKLKWKLLQPRQPKQQLRPSGRFVGVVTVLFDCVSVSILSHDDISIYCLYAAYIYIICIIYIYIIHMYTMCVCLFMFVQTVHALHAYVCVMDADMQVS